MNQTLPIALTTLVALASIACGGGSSAGPAVPAEPQPSETAPFTDPLDSFDTARWAKADWANGDPFLVGWLPSHATVNSGILTLTLDAEASHGYAYSSAEYRTVGTYGHGTFTVRMKAAKGSGIVSSFFLYADSGDEIDVEFLGKDTNKVQLNYYLKRVGGHEKLIDLGFDASADYHTYAIEWVDGAIRWSVDGTVISTVTSSALPTDAMKVMMNLWTGSNTGWLGQFSYSAPIQASYDSVSYAPPPQ